MNEKKYAEEILNGNNLGDNVWYTLSVLAKYFYSQGMSKKEIRTKLNALVTERLPMVPPGAYDNFISKTVKKADKSKSLFSIFEFGNYASCFK